MKQRRGLLNRLAEEADLPGEPMPRVPLIEIAGQNRVLIENHQGVCEYGREQIQVQVSYGTVCICGAGLELARMNGAQLVISGRIDSVSLIRRRV